MVNGIAENGAKMSVFYPQKKSRLLSKWQGRWNRGEMGRYAFSISPRVQFHPWFHGLKADRPFITVVPRLMSNHTRDKFHFKTIKIPIT
jgi:hypothetical protein